MKRRLEFWKRKLQFCSRAGLLIAIGAALGLTTVAQGGDACTDPDATITVEILTDNFGNETTWEVVEQGVGVIASGGPYPNNTLITVDVPVCSTSCYDFTIFDSFGDGICCGYGNGFYNIFYEGNLVCSGGVFGSSETCPDIGAGCAGGDDCTDPDATITVEILTDNFGNETTWELVEQGVGVIAVGGPYPSNTLITVDVPVCSTSCYDFTIFDSFGDGICCSYGNGFYNIFYEGNLVCSGGVFGSSETCPDIGAGCAGPDCGDACTDPDATITVEILTDNFGNETTWELVEQGVGVIAVGGPYPNNTLITVDVPVCSTNCYDFTIFDAFGDGICCGYGNGFYNIFYEGNLVCSGGVFGSSETCPDIGASCPCEPLSNDLCENAIPLGVPGLVSVFGSTVDATIDDEFPFCEASITAPGVWYSVIGTGNTMTASTCSEFTNYDTKISVYCNSCVEPFCVVGADDNCGNHTETVEWCSQAGAVYLILVHGFLKETGDFELIVTDDGVPCDGVGCLTPENDLCEDAIGLSVPSSVLGSTNLSTIDDEFPDCDTSITAPGVWYSVIGTGNTMTASDCSEFTDYDTKISVFCNSCVEPFCVVGADDNCPGHRETVEWCTQEGAEYLILVHGFETQTGNFELTVFDDGVPCGPVDCPPKDTCPWDITGNGIVGVNDLLKLLGSWGPCPPKGDCSADFDDSGDVGVKDLLALLGNWGPCP